MDEGSIPSISKVEKCPSLIFQGNGHFSMFGIFSDAFSPWMLKPSSKMAKHMAETRDFSSQANAGVDEFKRPHLDVSRPASQRNRKRPEKRPHTREKLTGNGEETAQSSKKHLLRRGGQPLKRRILHGQGYNPYKEDPVPKWDKIWDEIEKEYGWPEHFVDKRQVCLKIRQRTQIRYDRETKRCPDHQMLFPLFCLNHFPIA